MSGPKLEDLRRQAIAALTTQLQHGGLIAIEQRVGHALLFRQQPLLDLAEPAG